ncbi:MAG: cell division protein FtsX [Deltaproteobacteria bacterium RIFOXYD12_FULL_57_12]|nr:MAG: cell division protein FtsX [Deltaproteobacteria bacterium RIFOXYD12_FULL_57_12]
MKFISHVLTQTGRNLQKTWPTQFMTLLTVSLSVLIFAFFFLIYTNVMKASEKLGDNLRLTIYLEDEPVPEMQEQLKKKINDFNPVEKVLFVSRAEAFQRLAEQLGDDRDILTDMNPAFLPPSIEVYPEKDLNSLARIKVFSDYLATLPGATKVQYGHGWVERFHYFTKLIQLIVVLSGVLLILTSTFMVAYTIRLAVINRQAELEILRLLGATNSYIQMPFVIEGLLQGLLGSALGILSLHLLYRWIAKLFSGPTFLNLFEFTFFAPTTIGLIVAAGILLCTVGSLSAMRKFLRI